MRLPVVVATALAGALVCSACSTTDSRMNGVADNLAGEGVGDVSLKKAGVELKDKLSCIATPGVHHDGWLALACTATTIDGKKVRLAGSVTEAANDDQGKGVTRGDFTGTVDGREVLRTDCLGSCTGRQQAEVPRSPQLTHGSARRGWTPATAPPSSITAPASASTSTPSNDPREPANSQ